MRKQHKATTTTTHPPLSVALHIHDGARLPLWDALWRDLLLPPAPGVAVHCPHPTHLEPPLPRLATDEAAGAATEGGARP